MPNKDRYGQKYGRHSSFRHERDTRSTGASKWTLLLLAVAFIAFWAGRSKVQQLAPQPSLQARLARPPATTVSPSHPPQPQTGSETPPTLAWQAAAQPNLTPNAADREPSPANLIEKKTVPTEDENDQPDIIAKYVMDMNAAKSFVGKGQINGKEITVLADTGASTVIIPEKTALRLGLKRGEPLLFKTGGGPIVHYATKIDSLILGQIEIHDVTAAINPAMPDDFILLGMSALGMMEMQLLEGKLVLSHKARGADEPKQPPVEIFKRSLKDCAGQGNKFDKQTLDCLRGK